MIAPVPVNCFSITFITFPHQAAGFLVYPWKPIPSTSFPNWDEFVYTLLKSGSEHALYCSGSKVRLFEVNIEIPRDCGLRYFIVALPEPSIYLYSWSQSAFLIYKWILRGTCINTSGFIFIGSVLYHGQRDLG